MSALHLLGSQLTICPIRRVLGMKLQRIYKVHLFKEN